MKMLNKLKYHLFCWMHDICPYHMQPRFMNGKVCLTCTHEVSPKISEYEYKQEAIKRNLNIAAQLRDKF